MHKFTTTVRNTYELHNKFLLDINVLEPRPFVANCWQTTINTELAIFQLFLTSSERDAFFICIHHWGALYSICLPLFQHVYCIYSAFHFNIRIGLDLLWCVAEPHTSYVGDLVFWDIRELMNRETIQFARTIYERNKRETYNMKRALNE